MTTFGIAFYQSHLSTRKLRQLNNYPTGGRQWNVALAFLLSFSLAHLPYLSLRLSSLSVCRLNLPILANGQGDGSNYDDSKIVLSSYTVIPLCSVYGTRTGRVLTMW
jgi:hypothetical protein